MKITPLLNLKNLIEEIQHLTPYLEIDEFNDLESYFLIKNNLEKIIDKTTQLIKDLEEEKCDHI